ncbi:MAG: aminopeptidase P family protein, partial [Minwuiales bacterium]|nr:aminopeptidase P family protein [Minwuiales bacterium]
DNLTAGQRLGFDPWLHTERQVQRLRAAVEKAGAELVAVADNPIDAVWSDQPAAPGAPVVPHPIDYAGREAADKRAEVAKAVQEKGADAAVLTLPDSIAWLLNIRGADVPHSPLPLGFAILHDDATVDLILDRRKVTPGLTEHLGNGVALHERDGFGSLLDRLGTDGKRVRVDPAVTGVWVANRLKAAGATVQAGRDPCTLPKACKNDVEVAGARSAHVRDGAAVTRFLAWLARASGNGALDEIAAADRLRAFRMENDLIEDLSFTTISGAGPNGAIVHYRVTPETNRKLEPGSLFLVDSGAQYLDGTTDITRTVAIGRPSDEMRERFTRVLKGHIAIATCRFPEGTDGGQIDALARHALWQVGLDFDHGTGHGVGSYLNVHEGPQRISKMGGSAAMKPGMIVSNEPGYYKTGEYGIRIENLVVVRDAAEQPGERKLLEFETLTRAPIDRALVDVSLLTDAELDWLNRYHATVRADIAPLVDDETVAWLKQATEPIER